MPQIDTSLHIPKFDIPRGLDPELFGYRVQIAKLRQDKADLIDIGLAIFDVLEPEGHC